MRNETFGDQLSEKIRRLYRVAMRSPEILRNKILQLEQAAKGHVWKILKSDTRKFVLRKAISKREKTLKRLHLMRNRRRLIAGFRGLRENLGAEKDINSSASV